MKCHVRSYCTRAAAVLAAAFGMAGAPVLAGGVDAGTLIDNRAEATFENANGAQTAQSNTVTLRVDEVLDAALASLDPGPISVTGGSVVLTYALTNPGNGSETYTLTVNPAVSGNDFDLTIGGIAIDTNGNGVYDDGADQLFSAPETSPPLAADETVTVFVLASVPGGSPAGSQSTVELQAAATTSSGTPGNTISGAGEGGSDAVVGANGAQAFSQGSVIVSAQSVELSKTANVTDPFGGTSAVPGATISYTIAVSVTGTGAVDDLIITDAIPDGTTYVPGTLQLNAAALSDASGDDAGEASTSGIMVALGTTPAGAANTITFDVLIEN